MNASSSTPSSGRPAQGSAILKAQPLSFPWPTIDPFLFCAHHDDAYPAANGSLGPAASLAGRPLGQDFSRKDGWSMYHGQSVPGFPAHPHRGFETVTIVRTGLIDHSDSLGAIARFGQGDVQWLTAGEGIVHAEMFPLLKADAPNPLELFQIWLNLPARSKMAKPHFTMIWSDAVPRLHMLDAEGRATQVAVIAGRLETKAGAGAVAGAGAETVTDTEGPAPLDIPTPPPDSWAAEAASDVAIWTVQMAPGAHWTLPAAQGAGTQRSLYFFKGSVVRIDGERLDAHAALELRGSAAVALVNEGDEPAEFLLLQGQPMAEPVVQYGPFVMNTEAEIRQALADYRRTQFGGWPWADSAPVHGHAPARFARHPDGREERPLKS